jgi:hypothetical protein
VKFKFKRNKEKDKNGIYQQFTFPRRSSDPLSENINKKMERFERSNVHNHASHAK